MNKERLVLAVDQGTSSTKALLFNSSGEIVEATLDWEGGGKWREEH